MADKTDKKQRDDLLNIEAAAQYMGVSRSTFNNIRKENNLPEVLVGKRPRFLKHQLDSILSPRTFTVMEIEKSKTKVALNILSTASIEQIEIAENTKVSCAN